MDVTPLLPAGRQIIESYGDGQFRVSGRIIRGPAIIMPDRTEVWDVAAPDFMTSESFEFFLKLAAEDRPQILIIGCGTRMSPVPSGLRRTLRDAGVILETMDTGAACRTYNVLLAEGRRVAAALMPVD